MKLIFLSLFCMILTCCSTQENKSVDSEILMTIRGFDYLKSDGLTQGNHLNNAEILDQLVDYLVAHPGVKVALKYHAACGGQSPQFWKSNTEKRAESCKSYVTSNAIDPGRVLAYGVGISELLVDCNCGDCTEEDLNKNHRLEVVLVNEKE